MFSHREMHQGQSDIAEWSLPFCKLNYELSSFMEYEKLFSITGIYFQCTSLGFSVKIKNPKSVVIPS